MTGKKSNWWRKLTPEQKQEKIQMNRENRNRLTPEQKEEINKKRREHRKKIREMNCEKCCKRYEKLTPEQKEERNKKQREYRKNLTPEQKEERNRKNREYLKNLIPEQKIERNKKRRKHKRNITTEQKEEKNRKAREKREKLTPEQKEKNNRKRRKYWKELNPEQREVMRENWCEYWKTGTSEQKTKENQVKREKFEYCEGHLKTFFSGGMTHNFFCNKCHIQFLNNSALLEHITIHVTLPSIILSRIDRHKGLVCVKKENENMEMNSDLYSNIPRNVIYIKTESMEYDEDIKYKFNNIHVNKTLDSIKKESENTLTNSDLYSNIPENVICIKTESMECDENIQYMFNDIHGNTKTEAEIEIDYASFYTNVKKEIK